MVIEEDIKEEDKEVDLLGEIAVSANNQGKSIPRKRDYRQRAHCNPLSNGKWEDLPTAPDSFREDVHFERAFLDKLRMEKKEEKEAKITFADIGCGFARSVEPVVSERVDYWDGNSGASV